MKNYLSKLNVCHYFIRPLFGHALLLACVFLAILGQARNTSAAWVPAPGEPVDIARIIASMSREEKVGQLMMVGFGGTTPTAHSRKWIRDRHVGGAALFSRNIKNLRQTAELVRALHRLTKGKIPVFLSLDQEGGNVVRVKEGATLLPGNMALGATRSPTLAYVAGQAVAIDLRLIGFNMNLAPVLDVNSNPANPVIGIRSYGESPGLVADLGAWFIRGQQEMGIAAVAKHFPGHGDTQSDSHFAMPSIDADLERLERLELAPFAKAIDTGLDAIMTAHIAVPHITGDAELPATLSHQLLTDILRTRLGFNGIIVTDGLEMRGIVERYGSGRAAVLAILAGADMPMVLWTPKVKEEVYQAMLTAVAQGEITDARLDESVHRILTVKRDRGLFDRQLPTMAEVMKNGNNNPIHTSVAARIASEAVTLVRNEGELLPLEPARHGKIVVFSPTGAFADYFRENTHAKVVTVSYVPNRSRRKQALAKVVEALRGADLLIAAVTNRYHLEILTQAMEYTHNIPVVAVSFASPYYLSSIPQVDAYLCTYSYLEVPQRAAAQAILGETPMTGTLPISIPGFYAYGHKALGANEQLITAIKSKSTSAASMR